MKPPIFDTNWSEEIKALYRHDIQEMWTSLLIGHVWNQYHNQLRVYLELAGSSELTGERKISTWGATGNIGVIDG